MTNSSTTPTTCRHCNTALPSRNQLFTHVRKICTTMPRSRNCQRRFLSNNRLHSHLRRGCKARIAKPKNETETANSGGAPEWIGTPLFWPMSTAASPPPIPPTDSSAASSQDQAGIAATNHLPAAIALAHRPPTTVPNTPAKLSPSLSPIPTEINLAKIKSVLSFQGIELTTKKFLGF